MLYTFLQYLDLVENDSDANMPIFDTHNNLSFFYSISHYHKI